jgi:hypothetical protein
MTVEMAKMESIRDERIGLLASMRFTHRWVSSAPEGDDPRTYLDAGANLRRDEVAMNNQRRITG